MSNLTSFMIPTNLQTFYYMQMFIAFFIRLDLSKKEKINYSLTWMKTLIRIYFYLFFSELILQVQKDYFKYKFAIKYILQF